MATSLNRAPRSRYGACEFCGKPFQHPDSIRSDKQFCNSTRRSAAAHRREWSSDRVARARELTALVASLWTSRQDLDLPGRGSWTSSVYAVEACRLDRRASDALNGVPEHVTAFREIERSHGEYLDLFGPAVVRARLMPVPAGVCRTCVAVADARAHRTKLPTLDAADRLLLGASCEQCRRTLWQLNWTGPAIR
jgi:hypothetical protein